MPKSDTNKIWFVDSKLLLFLLAHLFVFQCFGSVLPYLEIG